MRAKHFVLIIALLTLIGCSSGFSRQGYMLESKDLNLHYDDCNIVIKFKMDYDINDVEVLGEIRAYDTGFSVQCDEAYVLTDFFYEACALGADIVNITEEKYPNFWSTCYRAKATFLRLKDRQMVELLKSDDKYAPEHIQERSKETARRTKRAIEAGVMGGMVGGLTAPH